MLPYEPRFEHFCRLIGSMTYLRPADALVLRGLEAMKVFLEAQGAAFVVPSQCLVARFERVPGRGTNITAQVAATGQVLGVDLKWRDGLVKVSSMLADAFPWNDAFEISVNGFKSCYSLGSPTDLPRLGGARAVAGPWKSVS